MQSSSKGILVIVALLALVAVSGVSASDQARPFRGQFLTTFTPPGPGTPGCDSDPLSGIFVIAGEGHATHLGRTTFVADSEANNLGAQCGHTVLSAANGDELEFDFSGGSTPPDPEWNITFSGIWTITGGTGRFRDAEGGGTYSGTANLLAGEGELSQVGALRY